MDKKVAFYLKKLVIEDDDDDLIRFSFPNQKTKVKCYKSLLCNVSPVFNTMFSEKWCTEQPTIELDDHVTFDQYLTFKLFVEILYGLAQVDSLSVEQATAVYFYSNKYQVKDVGDKIQKFLSQRMEPGMSKKPFSVNELEDGIQFAQLYDLDDFKKKLDHVKLAFDAENPIKFFDLANKFEMHTLKQQVIDHLKTVGPQEAWTMEISHSVIKCLQSEKRVLEKEKRSLELKNKQMKQTWDTLLSVGCLCYEPTYSLQCNRCRRKADVTGTINNF